MEITENLKHLNISIQEKVSPITRETQNDDQKEIANFATVPISIKDYYTVPYLYSHGTLDTAENAWLQFRCFPANLLYQLNNMYTWARSDFRFRLIIRSSFNHTGLISFQWIRYIGQSYTGTLFNPNIAPNPTTYSPMYCFPNMRSFLRLGKDIECELTVPWLAPLPCCYLADTAAVDDYPSVNTGNSGNFELFIRNITPLRTIAGATQTIEYFIYFEPVNVHVGGLRSG